MSHLWHIGLGAINQNEDIFLPFDFDTCRPKHFYSDNSQDIKENIKKHLFFYDLKALGIQYHQQT